MCTIAAISVEFIFSYTKSEMMFDFKEALARTEVTLFMVVNQIPINGFRSVFLCAQCYTGLWLCVFLSVSIPPSLTASLIEIRLSSAFSVTHTQKWDTSLPPQSVSVTELTLGRDSGHFAHFFFFLSLSLPLSPPTRHLEPRWSRCGRRKLSLCALPFAEKFAAGQREKISMNTFCCSLCPVE